MVITQTEVETQIIEMSAKALGCFCNDISQMFGIEMSCNQREFCTETVLGLKKNFGKLSAVVTVESEGILDGDFRFVFDKIGLFTLSGAIVMLPEQRILNYGKYGSAEDAERMKDTMGEAGNLLVGSWDRFFREEFEGHGHFTQSNTFIGNPWNEPIKTIGLDRDEELLLILHEITIGSYPPFKCGVVFSKRIFADASESETETTDNIETEENAEEEQATVRQTDFEDQKTDALESESEDLTDNKSSGEEEPEADKADSGQESVVEEQPEQTDKIKNDIDQIDAGSDNVEKELAVATNEFCEEQEDPVSKSIKAIADFSANPLSKFAGMACGVCAKDIMQKKVIWANGDNSVQQALTKMEEAGCDYLIVGTSGVIEGIVSRSDLSGAMSPYLRPMFAKWHRPLDDATLQIKIKWIMSRLVRTVSPETSFSVIIHNMCQRNGYCLPVVDNHGKVQGMVTTFDIFNMLLKAVFT